MEPVRSSFFVMPVIVMVLFSSDIFSVHGFALRLYSLENLNRPMGPAEPVAMPVTEPPEEKPVVQRKIYKLPQVAFSGFRPRFLLPQNEKLRCEGYVACKENLIKFLSSHIQDKRLSIPLALRWRQFQAQKMLNGAT